jgi:K+-sensing histidine kinase KdpD
MVGDMSLLLENLLQWSKYQAQVQRLNPQPNEVSALVHEATNSLKFAAAEKQIALDSTIEEGLQVYADSDMIKALLKTVLQNAISLIAKEGAVLFSAVRQDTQVQIQVQLRGEMPLRELFLQTFEGKEYNSNQSDAGKSFSLGWMFCKSVVANNKGNVYVNKIAGDIIEILILLPLHVQ